MYGGMVRSTQIVALRWLDDQCVVRTINSNAFPLRLFLLFSHVSGHGMNMWVSDWDTEQTADVIEAYPCDGRDRFACATYQLVEEDAHSPRRRIGRVAMLQANAENMSGYLLISPQ